jgi:hypothetical protein
MTYPDIETIYREKFAASEQGRSMNLRNPVPDIPTLARATVNLLRPGPQTSHQMRETLAHAYGIGPAGPYGLDPAGNSWDRFVNNHAWGLVRLQNIGVIRKLSPGLYELVDEHSLPPTIVDENAVRLDR